MALDRAELTMLLSAVQELASAQSWSEREPIVARHPYLLDPDTDEIIAFLGSSPVAGAGEVASDVRRYLLRCRTVGVNEATAEDEDWKALPKSFLRVYEEAENSVGAGMPSLDALRACMIHPAFGSISHRYRTSIMRNAAVTLLQSYREIDDRAALDEAVSILRRALTGRSSAPVRGMLLNALAVCLDAEFELTSDIDLLLEAGACHTEAIQLTPATSPLRVQFLRAQKISAWRHSELAQDEQTISHAISLQRELLLYAKTFDAETLASEWHNLGLLLSFRYRLLSNVEDFSEALICLEHARAGIFHDSSRRSALLLAKALLHYKKAQFETDQNAARLALKICRECLDLSDQHSDEHFKCLMLLGDILSHLIDRGDTVLLEQWECLSNYAQDVAVKPDNVANALGNLGRFLQTSYLLTRERAQLDRSIDSFRQAVSLQQKPSSVAELYTGLGGALHHRYNRDGDDADLSEALWVYDAAAKTPNATASERARRFNNVGVTAREKYDRIGSIEYLEQAISAHEKALSYSTNDPAMEALSHHNLGFCLRQLYERVRQVEHLKRAVAEHELAISICPADWNERPTFLTNLGSSLLEKFWLDHDETALSRAIQVRKEAYDAVSPSSAERVGFSHHLAAAISTYCRTEEDRARASALFREACELGLILHVEEALISAINWVRWSFKLSNWPEVIEAHHFFQSAVDTLVRRQVLRSAKEGWLRNCQGVALRAAYAMSKLDRTVEAAEILERDRARISGEVISRERVDLRTLEAAHGELFQRFRDVVRSWMDIDQLCGELAEDVAKGTADLRSIRSEFDGVVSAVRKIAGFEKFLMDADFCEIASAAADYPLAYIGATELGGLALLVASEKVTVVWLNDLKDGELRRRLDVVGPDESSGYFPAYMGWLEAPEDDEASTARWFAALDGICEWLWQSVVGQLLESLGSEKRVTLVPLGLIGMLPIHAAWTVDNGTPTGRRFALDQCKFRYAANARALSAAAQAARTAAPEALMAVLNPDNLTSRSLRGAQWETDLAEVHFARKTLLRNHDATRARVLAALKQCDIAHFACHGIADFDNPSNSRLELSDGDLSVRDFLEMRLTNSRLAVLSACETGLVGMQLPDEVVGLPLALSEAGFPGVVATLWSVADHSTALLMTRFYYCWLTEKQAPVDALRQAQIWLRDTPDIEKLEFLDLDLLSESAAAQYRKALYLKDEGHILKNSFSHPFYWAAFTYTGV
jgi:tetratricopeptide (TPR) repeat protein